MEFQTRQPLELWGGVECTINRVRDEYFEQLRRTGHLHRISDFERFASLGMKALRQPILWECGPSHASESERWEWARAALAQLASFGIRPIVGLLHHGSGPLSTNLLDPNFPQQLAAYALQVATRFPDVQDYTPVNEPLTTARFSALYGHWYPHCRNGQSFARALLHQCRGVVLAMQAIRRVNPSARLIQTDDLGKVYSTPALAYQAEFENERRWSTYDILCGRFDSSHCMWHYFRRIGIEEDELQWFVDHPCPPDVIGLNHYLSSDRYLDEHLERYPADTHGGNGRHRYADVLASRVLRDRNAGAETLLMECWQRYGIPIAITECHNGCTREEQLRWFVEVWRSAQNARLQGAQIIAVTAWSLLGAFDWGSLVTEKKDHYEPGVFDIRSSPPRPTALARLIHGLGTEKEISEPVLDVPGWWHRPRRFVYGISIDELGNASPAPSESVNSAYPHVSPVLIVDADRALGRAFARHCESRGIPYRGIAPSLLNPATAVSVRRVFDEVNPWAVICTSSFAHRNDSCVGSPNFRGQREIARQLARECKQRGVALLALSSDLVFDGEKRSCYIESDEPIPLNEFGRGQACIEKLVNAEMPSALIVRSGPLFGRWGENDFVARALRCFRSAMPFAAVNDVIVSPTYTPHLVDACLDLLVDAESGIWHVANPGEVSWAGLATMAARVAQVSCATLRSCTVAEAALATTVPRYTALTSERGVLLPNLEDALAEFIRDWIFQGS